MEFLIQLLGILGLLAFVLSYQIRSNRALFLMQSLGALLFCIQFVLLGALSGCLSLLAVILRNCLLAKRRDWKWVENKSLELLFCGLFLLILPFSWTGLLSLLPFIASVGSTLAYWTGSAKNIRLANLFCACPAWLIYDVLVGSWGGALNECITLASIILSIKRFGWKALEEF